MNKLTKFFCMMAAVAAMTGCGDTEAFKNSVEYFPFKGEKTDNWGLVSTDGTVLFENEFEERPSAAYNGRFTVKNANGLYELFTTETKPKKVGKDYKTIGTFFEDVTPAVEPNKPIDFIDKDGNVKFTLDKVNGKAVHYVENFVDGIAVFSLEGGGMGCINTTGKVVVEPEWVSIDCIGDGKMLAISKKDYNEEDSENSKISVIDYNGKVISVASPNKLRPCSAFSDGYAIAYKRVDGTSSYGVINEECEWVVKPNEKYHGITQVRGGMFVYGTDDDRYGVSKIKDGEVVVRPKYEIAVILDENRLLAKDNHGCKLMTVDEEDITEDEYIDIAGPFDGNFIAKDGEDSYMFLDGDGKPVDKKQSFYLIAGVTDALQAIYNPSELGADETVFNDFVDIAGIVAGLNITADGMNGLTLNSSPKEVVTEERGLAPDDEETLEMLSRSNSIGCSVILNEQPCNVTVEYDYGEIVDQEAVGFGAYTFTLNATSKPKAIKAEFDNCDKITGKQKEVYKAICAELEKAGWTVWDNERENAKGYKKGNLFVIAYYGTEAGLVLSGEDCDDSSLYDNINMNFLSDI